VVTREARSGEQGCAGTREGRRYENRCKNKKKKGCTPVEAESTVNDTSRDTTSARHDSSEAVPPLFDQSLSREVF
jgi:hypothetical protein